MLRKVYHYWKTLGKSLFDGRTNRMQAMKIHVGDTVRVIAGRKFKKGSVGKVFWCGTCRNPYSGCTEESIGIEVDGNRQFINESQAELIGWEARLPDRQGAQAPDPQLRGELDAEPLSPVLLQERLAAGGVAR